MKRTGIFLIVFSAMLCLVGVNSAVAFTFDLTVDPFMALDVNGANFYAVDADLAGRGVFPTFLAIQGHGETEGFNTDYRPLSDLGMDYSGESGHTHSVLISDMGPVSYDGVDYWSFILDIDQAPGSDPYLTLAELKVYLTADPALSDLSPASATNFYDLGVGNTVLMDYTLNLTVDNGGGGGSGKADMVVDIPIPANLSGFTNVVLYSKFTGDNDGPEEWSYLAGGNGTSVPEPSTITLLGLGLVGISGFGRRKFKK